MSLTIALSFPHGHFHATSWENHVNEGIPEWPPSPWRFLRALVFTWKRKLYEEEQLNNSLPSILNKISKPPIFKLPPASIGHSRHYMPLTCKEDAKLIFDTFVALNKNSKILIIWKDITLDSKEEKILKHLLNHLNYFGRAESWCSTEIFSEDWKNAFGELCYPVELEENPNSDFEKIQTKRKEHIRVLCANSETWNQWDYNKKAFKPDPKWNLLAEMTDIHQEKWADPPGSQWITYIRSSQAFAVRRPFIQKEQISPSFNVARFALSGNVLPLLTETVYFAERVRQSVQGIFRKKSPNFSGKDSSGEILKNNHQHTFYLPVDEDGDGRLDHLILSIQTNFLRDECRSISSLQEVKGPSGILVDTLFLGFSKTEQPQSIPILATSKKWRSITPYIPTKHYKSRYQTEENFLECVLREDFQRRGFIEPKSVKKLKKCNLWKHQDKKPGRELSWLEFRRERIFGNGVRANHPGTGFIVEFDKPVNGPMALGYGCHFGLGLFAPTK